MAAKKKQVLTKKQQKQIKKIAKKNPKVFIIAVIVAIVVAGIGFGIYKFVQSRKPKIESGEVQINFLELGNDKIGDSTFIKVGDIDILIDAGSTIDSVDAIESFINTQVTDNKLEYVVATHAHKDHIGAFVGSTAKGSNGGILDHYKVDNLIQFSQVAEETLLYQNFCTKVENLKSQGTKVYDTATLIDENKNVFELDENITLTVLDQKYYHQKSSNENNHSVCTLLTQGNNNYLFTGDLEKAGEESLVESNPRLPHCQLFKGGHHGSITSSNECLLEKISPEVVCMCTCCGTSEYQGDVTLFPNQVVLDRIGVYTDKIYCTGSIVNGEYKSLNGRITFICKKGSDYYIECTGEKEILRKTTWFSKNRVWNGIKSD